MRTCYACLTTWLIVLSTTAQADGPQDNQADKVRPVPPPGIKVAADDQAELKQLLGQLSERIAGLRGSKSPAVQGLIPDVEIFHRAVRDALKYEEFFSDAEVRVGKELARKGLERAEQLAAGKSPWDNQTGLVVRGYISRIDGTVQPYGLVIPTSYTGGTPVRMDIWLHGRGEKVSEVVFLNQRATQSGQIAPPNTIVLHPYGRYCNAFKFAGEVDVLEAMADVQRRYRIDEDRIAIRGFSMGGAGCWQLAVHYPDLWFAATPGAGFSETPEFLRVFQNESLAPTAWERTLWRWYDCTGYAANLGNCPTIAYSGELDSQKQAADIMERSLAAEKISLTHLIGPQTKHSIHPDAAREIEQRLSALAVRGRDRVPDRVQFATYTLKYNRQHWLTVNGLEKHWEPARIAARIEPDNQLIVIAHNVSGFSLSFAAGGYPGEIREPVRVVVNGQPQEKGPRPKSDRSWSFHWWRGKMQPQALPAEPGLLKVHDLQGPIDDAFMDRFIVVRPTGPSRNPAVAQWADAEADRLVREWRRQFRGDAIVKLDTEISDEDIQSANLILFGEPSSNALMRRVLDALPVRWTDQSIGVGQQTWDAAHHAPVLIYPNPLNARRYVVLNSGFTYREYDYLNNARQVPRLPDWAIIDLKSPPNSKYPGKVVAAGFCGERWEILAP